MTTPFDLDDHLVIVSATIEGPGGRAIVEMALDTGATKTLIDRDVLASIGYEPDEGSESISVITASGNVDVPIVSVAHLDALEQSKENFPVVAHSLPANAGIEGLLGVDFLRGLRVTIDFREGLISIDQES